MRILKNALLGLGALFGLLIVVVIAMGISSMRFKAQQTPFVTRFATDLSQHWELADVFDRSSNSLIAQAGTAQGRQAIARLATLGTLRSVQDLELHSYSMTTAGTTAVFAFKGIYQNEEALVTITVIKTSGTVRVLGFHVDPVPGRNTPTPARVQT